MDVWRCSSIAKAELEISIYSLERVTGEPLGEAKTIEGPSGQFIVGQYYDDELNHLPNWSSSSQ